LSGDGKKERVIDNNDHDNLVEDFFVKNQSVAVGRKDRFRTASRLMTRSFIGLKNSGSIVLGIADEVDLETLAEVLMIDESQGGVNLTLATVLTAPASSGILVKGTALLSIEPIAGHPAALAVLVKKE
jgi:hypothetical protein